MNAQSLNTRRVEGKTRDVKETHATKASVSTVSIPSPRTTERSFRQLEKARSGANTRHDDSFVICGLFPRQGKNVVVEIRVVDRPGSFSHVESRFRASMGAL
ncbi:MAG: hypothetical protein ACI4NV_00525 [Thermoguttaceae bacterium]